MPAPCGTQFLIIKATFFEIKRRTYEIKTSRNHLQKVTVSDQAFFCKKCGTGGLSIRKHLGFFAFQMAVIRTLSPTAFVKIHDVIRFFGFIALVPVMAFSISCFAPYVLLGRSLRNSYVSLTLMMNSASNSCKLFHSSRMPVAIKDTETLPPSPCRDNISPHDVWWTLRDSPSTQKIFQACFSFNWKYWVNLTICHEWEVHNTSKMLAS